MTGVPVDEDVADHGRAGVGLADVVGEVGLADAGGDGEESGEGQAGGGQGGSRGRDGMGGYIFPSATSNVAIELFETACPAIIVEKEWVPDSAGAGQFRKWPSER